MSIWIEIVSIAVVFLVVGGITGTLSAFFGIGGGIVMVPFLHIFFKYFSPHPVGAVMHMAIGTSIGTMVFTSLASAYGHYRAGHVIMPLWLRMAPIVAIGALLGALTTRYLHSEFLRYFFIAFLIYIIARVFLKKTFTRQYALKDFTMPKVTRFGPVGFIAGLLAVWLGIGGTVITTPFFRSTKMPMSNATATAVSMVPAIAVLGSIGYIIAGWSAPGVPPYSLGYIHLPALIGLTIGSFVGVPIGVRLSAKIADHHLARWYVVLLIVVLIMMLV